MGAITDIEGRISPARLVSSRPGAFLVAFVVRRRLHELSKTADRALADPRVHREVRRAAAHASRASRRARRVGPTRALNDRRVGREMHRVRRHLNHAADLASHPRRSHRARNVALATAALVAAGTAYAARQSSQPLPDPVIEETDVVITPVA
ncbi:MAG TPA: hypothetical protein VFH74_15060 [Gaiellales bacterium]|nr:hypothetical protein [Gaiellales bacterium]